MGWCHEFGSSIRHGCDEPMVAGADSCSCTTCGVRCTGKFPSCSLVWQHGPKRVAFVRPIHGEAPGPPAQAAVPAMAPVKQLPAVREDLLADVEWLATTLEAVRADVRALKVLVAQQAELLADVQQGSPPARLVELVESLPKRIGLAVSSAMSSAVGDRAPRAGSPPAPPSGRPPVITSTPSPDAPTPYPAVAGEARLDSTSAEPAATATIAPLVAEPPARERPDTGAQGTGPQHTGAQHTRPQHTRPQCIEQTLPGFSAPTPLVPPDAGVEAHVSERTDSEPLVPPDAGVEAHVSERTGFEPLISPEAGVEAHVSERTDLEPLVSPVPSPTPIPLKRKYLNR